ncbi:MAG TPA: hypothetical protein PLZ51_14155 [Aggregatilineales bacterium]|nr:hypothetical protein [Aggregatilineales bacterium]
MPYTLSWLVDKRVLYLVVEGEVTANLIRDIIAESLVMAKEGIYPVHTITNATQAKSIPKNTPAILNEFKNTKLETTGFSVVITTNPLIRFLSQFLLKLFRLELRFASDLDDAMVILGRMDNTIPIDPRLLDED